MAAPVLETPDVPIAEGSFAAAKADAKDCNADSISLMRSAELVVALVEAEDVEEETVLVTPLVLAETVRDENKSEVLESVLVAVDDVDVDGAPPATCGPWAPCTPVVPVLFSDPDVELVMAESWARKAAKAAAVCAVPLFVLSIVEDASVDVDVVALVPVVPVLELPLDALIDFNACAI